MCAGEGEFGIVHRASFHGTDVAVKILKTSTDIAIGDFRTEISTLRQVHHPNAVQFLGACTKHQPYMLVTELMYGASLADAYRLENFQLSLRRSIELALDAARGMVCYLSPVDRKPPLEQPSGHLCLAPILTQTCC